jgi:repressor LexA
MKKRSMGDLSPEQAKTLRALELFRAEMGYAPSLRELAEVRGYRSKTAVEKHVRALERRGIVRRAPGRARGIELVNRKAG